MSRTPDRRPVDPDLLTFLATRANDYLLLVLILGLGFVALAAVPSLCRVERAYEVAARV